MTPNTFLMEAVCHACTGTPVYQSTHGIWSA